VNAAFARRVSRWIGINRLNGLIISLDRAREARLTTTLVMQIAKPAYGFCETLQAPGALKRVVGSLRHSFLL